MPVNPGGVGIILHGVRVNPEGVRGRPAAKKGAPGAGCVCLGRARRFQNLNL